MNFIDLKRLTLALYLGLRDRLRKRAATLTDEVDRRPHRQVFLEECEVFQHEGVVRHRDFLVQPDLYLGHHGDGAAGPAEEDDDDCGPHPLLEQEGGVQMLEQAVQHSLAILSVLLTASHAAQNVPSSEE